jgi:peptidoglycan/LPS O-acetylase OafA/YrhL
LFWLSIATFWFNWYSIAFIREPGVCWTLLWSLSVEEQFYFFYPLGLKLLRNERNLKLFLALFILLGPVSLWVGNSFFRQANLVEHNSFSGFGLIATGALLYLYSERYRKYLFKHTHLCAGLCVAGLTMMVQIYLDQPAPSDPWGSSLHPMLFGIGVFLFLLGAMHFNFFKAKFWRPIALNGKVSYGIYLYHAMVICLAVWLFPRINEYVFFCGVPIAVFLIALFSYHYFEVPVNRFIRKRWGEGPSRLKG